MLVADYTFTADDITAFTLHYLRRSPVHRRQYNRRWIFWIVWAVVIAGGAYLLRPDSPAWAVLGAVGLTFVALYPVFYRSQLAKETGQYADESTLGDRFRLTLTDEGLRKACDDEELFIRWRAMKGAVVAPEHTFILFHKGGVLILPKQGFQRAEDYVAVRDFVVGKVGTAA